MKVFKRIIVSPFVFGLLLTTHIFFVFKRTWGFLKYGGEWIDYNKKNEVKTIKDIYNKLQ